MNMKLKTMLKENTKSDIEIENLMYATVKMMKATQVTKEVVTMKFRIKIKTVPENRNIEGLTLSYEVNKNGTTKQLIAQLNEQLKVCQTDQNYVITVQLRTHFCRRP